LRDPVGGEEIVNTGEGEEAEEVKLEGKKVEGEVVTSTPTSVGEGNGNDTIFPKTSSQTLSAWAALTFARSSFNCMRSSN
jgi:hypothetical protein